MADDEARGTAGRGVPPRGVEHALGSGKLASRWQDALTAVRDASPRLWVGEYDTGYDVVVVDEHVPRGRQQAPYAQRLFDAVGKAFLALLAERPLALLAGGTLRLRHVVPIEKAPKLAVSPENVVLVQETAAATPPSAGDVTDLAAKTRPATPTARDELVRAHAEDWVRALPRGLDKDVTLDLDGATVRPDRVDRKRGVVYAIRPDEPDEIAAAEAELRRVVSAMDRQHPRKGGWTGKVVVYDPEVARKHLERIGADPADVAAVTPARMSAAHAGGDMGERDAAFDLGKRGFDVVIGPSGSRGHRLTEAGFDIVAYHPKTKELWIVDNKASGDLRRIASATALTTHLEANFDKAIRAIDVLADFPDRRAILDKLRRGRAAVADGKALPDDVKLKVSNAGGFASGITKRLKAQGVEFDEIVGPAVRKAREQDIAKARAAGKPTGRPVKVTDPPATACGTPDARARLTADRAVPTPPAEVKQLPELPDADLAKKRLQGLQAEVRSSARAARFGRLVRIAAELLGAAGDIVQLLDALEAAGNKITEGVFILVQEHALALTYADRAERLAQEIEAFRKQLDTVHADAWAVWTASDGTSTDSLWELRHLALEVSEQVEVMRETEVRLRNWRAGVRRRERLAKKLLDDPAAFASLVVAGVGSGIVVDIFMASEDLQAISSVLDDAVDGYSTCHQELEAEREALSAWYMQLAKLAVHQALTEP